MRKMSAAELELISYLIKKSGYSKITSKNLSEIYVEDQKDGEMGSLIFISKNKERKIGRDLGNIEFNDADGVKVIVNLVLDNHEDLYELDIWKTDFSPLLSFPCFSKNN